MSALPTLCITGKLKENLPCIWHTNSIWQKPVGERAPDPDEYCHKSVNECNSVKRILPCDPRRRRRGNFTAINLQVLVEEFFAKLSFDKYNLTVKLAM